MIRVRLCRKCGVEREFSMAASKEYCKTCSRERDWRKRATVINMLGGKCVSCGTDDYRVLQVDHVNDDGYLDRQNRYKSGMKSRHYSRIISGTDDASRYQLLCANCHQLKTNWRDKGIEYESIFSAAKERHQAKYEPNSTTLSPARESTLSSL